MKVLLSLGWVSLPLLLAACAPLASTSPSRADAERQPSVVQAGEPTPAPVVPAAESDAWTRWLAEYRAQLRLDPAAPAPRLSLSNNLVDWLASEDEVSWRRLEGDVLSAWRNQLALQPALQTGCGDQAPRLHAEAVALGQDQAATLLFRKAALCDPGNADFVNHLSTAAARAKRWQLGERHARLAIALDPGFISAYQELAYVLKHQQRFEELLEVVERGLDLDGDLRTKALLLARRGQAYWRLGKREQAISAFKGSRRIGGPAWVQSYLDGEQTLGEEYHEP